MFVGQSTRQDPLNTNLTRIPKALLRVGYCRHHSDTLLVDCRGDPDGADMQGDIYSVFEHMDLSLAMMLRRFHKLPSRLDSSLDLCI